ncbi:ATP-binding protein [Priestia aryabhattai]|uniref:ATP-binding protein n=1 Tax=Priestia aryabhattai TaxID=412384 RepID=UPI001C8D843C|nr:ATP-binding protein [Priestia aryabhattai]MBY0008795.1 ATP-binding protein [Priestia aryabhattai]MBY0049997.1 ATP-binding protein [Priestia aryabhattai]
MKRNGGNVVEMYQPEVNQAAEMYEITSNFGNPLELFREGISNAYDENASTLHISCYLNDDNKLIVRMVDNGEGMSKESLIKNFWGLGYTDKVKGSAETIGEKSHGTLIYLRSEKIIVETFHESGAYRSEAENPLQALEDGELFKFSVEEIPRKNNKRGTEITLIGFNQNVADNFKHDVMRDYIYWFTKLGSFQNELKKELGHMAKDFKVFLRGLEFEDSNQFNLLEEPFEECPFGHAFPPITENYKDLLLDKGKYFFKYYVRKWTGTKTVQIIDRDSNVKDVEYQYVIYYEGDTAKRNYNPALKPTGRTEQRTLYRVADRYGIYLAKDFIPVEKVNDWLPRIGDGSFTHTTALHGFINCQEIPLTSDRSSMASTQPKLADELRKSIFNLVKEIGKELKDNKDGVFYMKKNCNALLREYKNDTSHEPPIDVSTPVNSGDEPTGQKDRENNPLPINTPTRPISPVPPVTLPVNPIDREREYYEQRINRIKGKRYFEVEGESIVSLNNNNTYKASYKRKVYEPDNEAETYGVFMELYTLFPDLFPFSVLDYSSHRGIDLLVSYDNVKNPTLSDRIFYLELKYVYRGRNFNHPFHSLAYIVCWDIDRTIRPNSRVTNNAGEEALFTMEKTGKSVNYYLKQPDNPIQIQILPLKRIIEEKLGLVFKR